MLKNGIDIFEYYENIWNTGNLISNLNIRIEFVVKYFCVNELKNIINSLNEQNKEKAYNFFQNLQELQNKLSNDEKNVDLLTYSNYVQQYYINIFNEELYENITNQTIQKFNICADLIEVFKLYNALDIKLLKIQQYCRYKAVYLEDCLNNKKNIKRGGFEEFVYDPDKSYNINSNITSQNQLNNQKVQYDNKLKKQNSINNNEKKYPLYNNNYNNNIPNNNNNQNIQNKENNNNQNSDFNSYENYNYINNENDFNENFTNIIENYPDIPNDPYSLSQIYNDTNNLNKENNSLSKNLNDNIISKSKSETIENNNNLNNQYELNQKLNNENNSNSGLPKRKLYTNTPSLKNYIKESILSFDQNILFNKSKKIIINNKNAIMYLKLKQIDNSICLLQNSIKILKKYPKQDAQGFYN